MKKDYMIQMNFSIPIKQKQFLQTLAKARRESVSLLLRRMIAEIEQNHYMPADHKPIANWFEPTIISFPNPEEDNR